MKDYARFSGKPVHENDTILRSRAIEEVLVLGQGLRAGQLARFFDQLGLDSPTGTIANELLQYVRPIVRQKKNFLCPRASDVAQPIFDQALAKQRRRFQWARLCKNLQSRWRGRANQEGSHL